MSEMEKFSCAVNTNSAPYKTYVEKTCFSMYEDAYNSFMTFNVFVLLSFGVVVAVSVIYSLAVGSRVDDEIERNPTRIRNEPHSRVKKSNNEQGIKTSYVFYFYFFHLIARSMLGILFTILQHKVLYPRGFASKFSCDYPSLLEVNPNVTATDNASIANVKCNKMNTPDKYSWGIAVCNVSFAAVAMAEVIYLMLHGFSLFNLQSKIAWSCDAEFIVVYFLCKPYVHKETELTGVDNCTKKSSDIYKQKVLKAPLTVDINYGPNTSLDEMYIDVVIQTGQARHKFTKNMDRHEIYDVYMEVPKHSIHLKEIKDLFYPNKDTKGQFPRIILALGRPGIGKTVLTRKVMNDWANGTDEFYHDKIAFFYKFRWFNFDELQNVTLRTFLRFGTELNEDDFESIFDEISKDPKKVIVIFDGLDEVGDINEKVEDCLSQSKVYSNDSHTPMPAMLLFMKIVFGNLLEESTVLVTSRPTMNEFYSKLSFDRKVEIIGFTSDKIEEYVKHFCANNGKTDLKPKIWSHISSSSELKNLCYIPVNCFIVCITLLECLDDPNNDIGTLPTTLTELYEAAFVYFKKHHDLNKNKKCDEDVIKELQQLAFLGMENNELVFGGESVNERMREFGLLNCLPNLIFQIQAQFCFIHLTVQEFLAAKHIVETNDPEGINEFISSHFESRKWHLVLQFLAGLLGRKTKKSGQYKCCVLAFTKHLKVEYIHAVRVSGVCELDPLQILVMKCLREMKDEDIIKEIAATSPLKDVTEISTPFLSIWLYPSDLVAMAFVCKHLHFLSSLRMNGAMQDCVIVVSKFLQERCIKTLSLYSCFLGEFGFQHLLDALMNRKCHVKHTHSELTELVLYGNGIADTGVIQISEFIEKGHGDALKVLDLRVNSISSCGISKLCEVLSNEVCNQLTFLVGGNSIGNEGVRILCKTWIEKQFKSTSLDLYSCYLTIECISSICEVLSNEHCEVTRLSLSYNDIGDESVRTLCIALREKECKLTELVLQGCSLTVECMPVLCVALKDEQCGLTNVDLSNNDIGDEGGRMFWGVVTQQQCKLTVLALTECSLTDECMSALCDALRDERCSLARLDLRWNHFTDEHLSSLSDALKLEHCYLRHLAISSPAITEDGKRLLRDTENYANCKARGFSVLHR